jgi:hypothetical protein
MSGFCVPRASKISGFAITADETEVVTNSCDTACWLRAMTGADGSKSAGFALKPSFYPLNYGDNLIFEVRFANGDCPAPED